MDKSIQAGNTTWQIWYEDRFDRECPRQVQEEGDRLLEGLVALWTLHLQESVLENMGEGFSAFNLWLVNEKASIEILGIQKGQLRIKQWVSGGKDQPHEKDSDLLHLLAAAHESLLLEGKSSETLVNLAMQAANSEDFKIQLKNYLN